jgi:hypothetical protein
MQQQHENSHPQKESFARIVNGGTVEITFKDQLFAFESSARQLRFPPKFEESRET